MVSYIWGGNTGVATPDELAYRRRAAQGLLQSATAEPSRTLGQGIAAIAKALSGNYADYKLGQEETANRKAADDRVRALFAPASSASSDATVSPSRSDAGAWLNQRLQNDSDLKLTPAAAAGITGNLDMETGGFRHMQEINPAVPGSRGGRGWAMWTGPRRTQFETWAKSKGLDPDSREANYGNLKRELLETDEGKVLAMLNGVTDPAQAAQIFSNKYLRPGIPHMDRRISAAQRYASSDTPQPVRLAQAGGPSLTELMQAYGDPWVSENNRDLLKAYIDRQLKAGTPDYEIVKADDGALVRVNRNTGQTETVYKSTKQKPRLATPEEKNALGVAPDVPLVIGEDGRPSETTLPAKPHIRIDHNGRPL